MSDDTIPRHLRVALATATRAFQSGDFAVFGTFNEDLQPVVDAAMAQIRSRDATIGALRADAENMLWNLGGVSSVCMGALDADFTFDESSARAALHDAVKLRKERNAYRSALVDIARHVASPGAEDEADKLGVEDLPTLVECVTGCYTPKAGAEAEDLRRCMERYTDGPIADEMRAILDEVDARDSLAYLTEQDKPRIDVVGQLRERVAELEAALATERAARVNGIPSGSCLCPDCHGESGEHCERCDDDGYIVPCEGCKADAHFEDSDGVPLCGACVVELVADAAKEQG